MKTDTAPRGFVVLAVFLGVGAFFTLISISFLVFGWVQYKYLERSVVEKMDQYYLNITRPDREEYL
ncbi:MAG: hypothetical protein HY551_00710, partial [Elusimicrobia bacterium]|nr:hypothetical protein [Elusimicrobiota bacterium]